FERRRRDRPTRLVRGHSGQPLPHSDRFGQVLRAILFKLRLWVEKIALRWAAGLIQINYALRFRSEMWQARQAGFRVITLRETALFQQRGESGRADAKTESPEEIPARHQKLIFNFRIHPMASHYCLVITSSRLRIKLADAVYAASSTGFNFSSLRFSPTAR